MGPNFDLRVGAQGLGFRVWGFRRYEHHVDVCIAPAMSGEPCTPSTLNSKP